MFVVLKLAGKYIRVCRRFISSTTNIILKESLPTSAYQSKVVEKDKFEKWEKSGLFTPSFKDAKPKFSMVLPPPNVTGRLHLGHALACTVQDVIARHKKATGYNVLWIPGIDHAGIATQGVVERYLKRVRNLDRHSMGREPFVEEVWKWKNEHGDAIANQLRMLGCSLDWTREVFTMNPEHTHAVNIAFQKLFDRNLIYRKKALVNWCRTLKSTISDIEIELLDLTGPTHIPIPGYSKPVLFGQLYSFVYKVLGSAEEVVVATTQPETMLGDVAVAVHPNDERYKSLAGRRVINPITGRSMPIIFDDFVDMKFGTGAVKITPAHSKVDFDIAKEHNLEMKDVIGEDGRMQNSGIYDGLLRYDCREQVIQKLNKIGLLAGATPHCMCLPVCSRTGDIIDYLPKEQWFVSCADMNERASEMVKSGQLKIEPQRYIDNWMQWCADDRDWCISRQLWWGHQVPAYKCTSVDKEVVWIAAQDANEARKRASVYLRTYPDTILAERDRDVLDTWFSSAIYPFAALGWPQHHYSRDYHTFYPLSLMVTGHDILGFWVHRMVMLGLELTERLPFPKVLLHGIICDNKGSKMSKSKGNVIDPVDVINGISMDKLQQKLIDNKNKGLLNQEELDKALKYHKTNFMATEGIPNCGADALRFTLLSHDIKSNYINFDINMCYANKLFCNKIWQSVRYLQLCFSKLKKSHDMVSIDDLTCFDKWILSRMQNMVAIVNKATDDTNFHLATKALRKFLYHEMCDVYLEATKPGFQESEPSVGYAHAHTLSAVLNTGLRCLNPYMVYLTQEIIPKIPSFQENIIYNYNDLNKPIFDWPVHSNFQNWEHPLVEKKVEKILNTTSLVRELKGLCGISNRLKPIVCVRTADVDLKVDLENNKPIVLGLTQCKDIQFEDVSSGTKRYIKGFIDFDTLVGVEILSDDVDKTISIAKQKLSMKIERLEKNLAKLEAKIGNSNYVNTVPEYMRNREIQNLLQKKEELKRMQTDLGRLSFENVGVKGDNLAIK